MKNQISIIQAIKGHLQTLAPYYFRRISLPESEKLEVRLSDGDVVDGEYWKGEGLGMAILTHGLEGNSGAVYIRAMTKSYLERGWDVFAWNFRGCSGKLNLKPRLYHSGAIEDLKDVVQFCSIQFAPKKIHLAGFSLGGNLTLLFLAKEKQWIRHKRIERAIAISPPLNLASSSAKLEKWWNVGYQINFLRHLKRKIIKKESQFPSYYQLNKILKAGTLYAFDDACTAPVHGFENAIDYYRNCSSLFYLSEIETPTLIVLAKNDPMLARGNYEEAEKANPLVSLTLLEEGGHCGFWGMNVY